MLRIGNVQLETNVLLAPIAGYCDLSFRLVVRSLRGPSGGVGLACTDLLCPNAILAESEKTMWLAATCPEDQPLCMQLYGRHPDVMAEAARWAAANGATTIDINMGCPVDKVTKRNGGSKLLCEPSVAIDVVRAVVDAVDLPVTVKIRMGWDDTQIITRSLPPRLCDAGIAAITVHGRTTEQKFRPSVRLHGITDVVEVVKQHHAHVAVIGNGDITCPQDARRMIDVTGCDGVMIGRGALGQPWIFRDTAHYLATGEELEPLPRAERARAVLRHFELLLQLRGEERIALNMIRSRISWYSAHLQPWPGLRRRVQDIQSAAEFRDFVLHGIERIEADEPIVYA